MNEKMLQRQIMFKQLQEMQRRQQLQEISNTQSQNYVNQLSSYKQASGGQMSPSVNGTPVQDPSGMFMVGNMQMMQHGGPNGLFLSQSAFGLSQPQSDISLYGSHSPNLDKNLNHYSHLQGPSNLSVNLLTKNNVQPSSFGSSFTTQQCSSPSHQISMPDGSVLSNQEKDYFGKASIEGFHGGNLSGNYPQQGISMQGNALSLDSEGRHEDARWGGLSPGKSSNLNLSVRTEDPDAASLDPLEQKILYNTDDSSWESPFSRIGKMGTGGFGGALERSSDMESLPSLQSGSWSALMQSALEETSGSDPGVQEEFSGLHFQNPEQSKENQQANFIESKNLQYSWVNRNSPNAISPSSNPDNLSQSFNNILPSSHQNQPQKDSYHSESSHATMQSSPRNMSLHADYTSQMKHKTGGSQLIQSSLPSSSIWPGRHNENSNDIHQPSLLSCAKANQPHNNFPGTESKADFWLQGITSHHVPSDIQNPYDQLNQLNSHGYSGELENMTPGEIVEARTTALGASLECPGENVSAPSESMLELLNKDDISNDHIPAMQLNSNTLTPLAETSVESFAKACKTSSLPPDFGRLRPADTRTPQSHSFFPSLSMGTSNATFLSSHNVNDHVENQCAETSVPSQMASQQYMSSSKPHKFSFNLFHSPDSASGSLETSSSAPNEPQCQNSFQHENDLPEYSGNSAWHEQRLVKGSSAHESPNEINSSTSLSCNIQKQEYFRKHQLGTDAFGSELLTTNMHQLSTGLADFGAINHSLSHQMHSRQNAGNDFKSSSPKYDSVNYQHLMVNAGKLFMSGPKSEDNDRAKDDISAVSQLGAFLSGDNKGPNFSQEGQGDHSGKSLSTSYHQNLQLKGMFPQNGVPSHSVGSNEASTLAYQSCISLPMAPSWFKHDCRSLKSGQMLPIFDPRAAIHASQAIPEIALENMQENSLIMQVNSASGSQGSHLCPSLVGTPITCKQLNPPSALPSHVTYQNLADSLPNKRKLVALDVVPWHKEVNHEKPRLQDVRTSELSWAQASNRREEEIRYEAESFEEVLPVIRPKRRLVSTTQLMQQVFQPAPAVILCADSSSHCEYIAYYAARLELGDACCLTGQLPSGSIDMVRSPCELKTSKRTNTSKYPKVVECLVDRVKKLEVDITRLEKSLSFVDIKVEALELEKFSTINRFAKFHIKANPSAVDLASSSGTTMPKPQPQRYVVGHPTPKIVPDGIDCLSL